MKQYWKRSIHLNNQGSTLLTILICAAFIGILGTLMISVTMTNLEMKMVASKSKDNFYSCEAALDEIRTGLQEQTADSIQTVYKDQVLVKYAHYLTMTETEVNEDIQKMVILELMRALTSETDNSKLASEQILAANLDSFKKYLINSSFNNPELSIESISRSSNWNDIIIKNIQIAYIKDDYKTSITTDIKITLPKFRVGETTAKDTYELKQPFEKYVLVADGGITSDNSERTNTITGSVYAGDSGISIHSPQGGTHVVKIQGDNIVTRGDITVKDLGNLIIDKKPVTEGSTEKPPVIWANNLVTEAASEDMKPILNINGISLIKGDLSLNGYNSVAAFTGAYVGFSGYRTQMGSAIMVNGSNSALDLSGLSSLILRGRAGVMAGDSASASEILTGESVAIKSNQRAYLVPGNYIGNGTNPLNHNPVSTDDINSLGVTVDTASLKAAYLSYVAADAPYKTATKHIGGIVDDDALNYYYLNFASGIAADSYMYNYYSDNSHKEVLNHMEPFELQYLKLPADSKKIKTIGNAASYSNTDSDPVKKVTLSAGLSSLLSAVYPTDSELDNVFQNMKLGYNIYAGTPVYQITVGSLENKYSKMTHLLSLENKEYADGDKVVASTLYIGNPTDPTVQDHGVGYVAASDALKNTYKFEKLQPGKDVDYSDSVKRIIVIDGNGTIKENSVVNGLLIASGDITIGNNAIINGLLIASGDITIGDNATINGMVISTCEKGSKYGITTGNGIHVNGRLVSCNQIKLGTNCTLSAAEDDIGEIFSKEGSLLQYIFKNVKVTQYLSMKRNPLINMSNMITYENWRKNK